MIWDLFEQSTFDKHFSNPDLQIVTLLLDENIITELKNQNPKLLDYLNNNKQQFIRQLIQYTVVMPDEKDGHDRCHKLPYISSELLAIDSELIYQQFFKEGVSETQNKFWIQLIGFLDTPAAHNEVLMGYFQKVFNNLYNGNKVKTTVVVAYFLEKFIGLAYNGSIGDMIKKSVILLVTPQGAVLKQRLKIVEKVIDILIEGSEQVKSVAADILVEVVNKFQSFSSGDLVLEKILNSKKLHQIYKIQSSAAVNLFLVGLLKKAQQKTVNQHDQTVPLIRVPTVHLQNIRDYLIRQTETIKELTETKSYLTNQNQAKVRKSNKKLYPLLQLICLSIESSIEEFISSELINNLWNVLVLYPYNNILQVNVLRIFVNILTKTSTQVRNVFLNHYQAYLLEIAKQNLSMFRPFIFTIWKVAKDIERVTTDQNLINQFQLFVQSNLQPLVKYEIDKNNLKHTANHNQKLIVDEEDKQVAPVQTELQQKGEVLETNKNQSYGQSFQVQDQKQGQKPKKQYQGQTQQKHQKAIKNPFEEFEFEAKTSQKDEFNVFNDWNIKPSDQLEKEKSKSQFDEFTYFQ